MPKIKILNYKNLTIHVFDNPDVKNRMEKLSPKIKEEIEEVTKKVFDYIERKYTEEFSYDKIFPKFEDYFYERIIETAVEQALTTGKDYDILRNVLKLLNSNEVWRDVRISAINAIQGIAGTIYYRDKEMARNLEVFKMDP